MCFTHDPSGSGVPEARAILLGIDMPGYLSLANLFAKVFGLICTLASGSTVFLGKVVRTSYIQMRMWSLIINLTYIDLLQYNSFQ